MERSLYFLIAAILTEATMSGIQTQDDSTLDASGNIQFGSQIKKRNLIADGAFMMWYKLLTGASSDPSWPDPTVNIGGPTGLNLGAVAQQLLKLIPGTSPIASIASGIVSALAPTPPAPTQPVPNPTLNPNAPAGK